jgi:malate synthase
VTVDGKPVSGSMFDFALLFFHNAKELLARGSGPYFYLPKMESHLEARLWNEIFVFSQNEIGIAQGSIKATALIETVVAAFEMDEILYELREHSSGLNIGRWDYIFSCIKKFRANQDFCLADRAQVTMLAPFMRAYAPAAGQDLPQPRRARDGRHGGADPDQERSRGERSRDREGAPDKLREVTDGCDGTWVAHPGLVPWRRSVRPAHAAAQPVRRASAPT